MVTPKLALTGESIREDMGVEKVILHVDGERLRRFQRGAGKDDEEFITAPVAGKVGRTDHVFQDTCDFADHLIPFGVTEGIIDMLEGVEVDHERGEVEPSRTGIFMVAAEHFLDRATIEETGEAVVAGSEGKLFLRLCEFFSKVASRWIVESASPRTTGACGFLVAATRGASPSRKQTEMRVILVACVFHRCG